MNGMVTMGYNAYWRSEFLKAIALTVYASNTDPNVLQLGARRNVALSGTAFQN